VSETKVPPEFEWIKPGVQVELSEDAWHGRGISQTLTVITDPYLPPNFDHWVVECEPDYGLLMWCDELVPAKNPIITLTLTCEQAKSLKEMLDDVLPSDWKIINWGITKDFEWLKNQIEEKLK